MSKKREFREDDLLGRFPPIEMENPEQWLLGDAEFEKAWHNQRQTSFPDRWFQAEREIRSDRVARTLLMSRGDHPGNDRASADVPDEYDVALQLLEEALPHLPTELAERVRHLLEK